MYFDNAFKTKAGKIGMQFIEAKQVFTAYRDKKNSLHVSEHATKEQKGKCIALYLKKEPMFQKWERSVSHIFLAEPAGLHIDNEVPLEAYEEELDRRCQEEPSRMGNC